MPPDVYVIWGKVVYLEVAHLLISGSSSFRFLDELEFGNPGF